MLSDWMLTDANNIKFNKYLKIPFLSANPTPEHPTQIKLIDICDKDGMVLVQKFKHTIIHLLTLQLFYSIQI
jgi:hypothetical protein